MHARFRQPSGDVTAISPSCQQHGLVRAFGASRRGRRACHARSSARCRRKRGEPALLGTAAPLPRALRLHRHRRRTRLGGHAWRAGEITTGDVVLTTSLGFTVLHASRDLAMALVEPRSAIRQARRGVRFFGCRMRSGMRPDATPLIPRRRELVRECQVQLSRRRPRTREFRPPCPAREKLGSSAGPAPGKSTILALLQRLYEPSTGTRWLIDGQNIAKVTQQSLASRSPSCQQDISLFHRSVLENLRYGKPEAKRGGSLPRRRKWRAARSSSAACRNGFDTNRRRARPQIVGRRTPAPGDCARLPARRANLSCLDEATRRSTPIPSS